MAPGLGILGILLALGPASAAAGDGDFPTPLAAEARDLLAAPDPPEGFPWIGPVYFSWFDVTQHGRTRGQFYSPWVPKDGRMKWDGSVRFHKRHMRYISRAGFNMIYAVDTRGYRDEQRNLFRAIRQRRKAGLPAPKVAPYFSAGSFDCGDCRWDFTKRASRAEFYQGIKSWFELFLDELGPKHLVRIGGDVLIGLWWAPGAETAPEDFFLILSNRLNRDFGFSAHWSVNFTWESGGPDEINSIFATLSGYEINEQGNIDLLAGFWPPANHDPKDFLARDRGRTLETAWDRVIDRAVPLECSDGEQRIDRIAVVSYNELSEGSGIYPARCVGHTRQDRHFRGRPTPEKCVNKPCHPHPKDDAWADCSQRRAAFHYLDLSKKKIRELEAKLRRRATC